MISALQNVIVFALLAAAFVAQVWALIDAAPRASRGFTSEGKLTKTKWLLILGGAALIGFISLPYPVGGGGLSFIGLLAAVPPIVYFVDVKPAVVSYGREKGGGSRGSGNRGGW